MREEDMPGYNGAGVPPMEFFPEEPIF